MINAFGWFSPLSSPRFWSFLLLVWCVGLTSASAQAPAQAAPPPAVAPAAPAPDGLTAPAPAPVYAQPTPAPYYYGQPGYVPVPPPRKYRPRRGLMIGGISMLTATYMIAVVSGAVMIDTDREACPSCKDVGPLLFIPWVGPFVAISQAREGDGLLVLLGTLQLAGAALTIGGVMLYFKTKKRAEEMGVYTWHLPEGRELALDLSTSPLRLGPSATLRF